MSNFWKIMSSNRAPDVFFAGAGRSVPLDVVRSARARRMSLRLAKGGGAVRLTLPPRAPLAPALRWVEEKRGWVEKQLARIPAPQPIVPGMVLPFRGETLQLDWEAGRSRVLRREGDRLMAGGPPDMLAGRVMRWLKAQALAELQAQSQRFAARAGVSVARVGVGDPASRWGSCSSSGTIRYSWRLILAPPFVLEATAAHEVAHRVHMNHSRAFHDLVAQLLEEDPRPARRWLATHGPALHRLVAV